MMEELNYQQTLVEAHQLLAAPRHTILQQPDQLQAGQPPQQATSEQATDTATNPTKPEPAQQTIKDMGLDLFDL